MAAYKRFVAYVYEYNEEQKGNNRGFIRVEAKDDLCKMSFHLRGMCKTTGTPCKIYGFVREDGECKAIYLGGCNLAGDKIEYQVQTPEQAIGNSEYSLSDLGGIILLSEDSNMYGTQWDDQPIILKKISFPEDEKTKEQLTTEAVRDSDATDSSDRIFTDGLEDIAEPEILQSEVPQPEERPETPQPGMPQPERSQPGMPQPERSRPGMPQPERPRPEMPQPQMPRPEDRPTENMQEPEGNDLWRQPARSFRNNTTNRPYTNLGRRPIMQPETEMNRYSSETTQNTDIDSKEVKQQTDVFEPFSDGDITECRKITPSELRMLNKKDHVFANNKFLLHGYYNYRHLLLGKERDTDRYILGVPGTYDQQEKFMAQTFGFPNFKGSNSLQSQDVHSRMDQFGYWYRLIDTPDSYNGNGF